MFHWLDAVLKACMLYAALKLLLLWIFLIIITIKFVYNIDYALIKFLTLLRIDF